MSNRLFHRLRRAQDPNRPMTCAEVARVLHSYLDESLLPPSAQQVAHHLEQCRKCGMEATTYRALKESLHRQGAVPDDTLQRMRDFAAQLAEDTSDGGS